MVYGMFSAKEDVSCHETDHVTYNMIPRNSKILYIWKKQYEPSAQVYGCRQVEHLLSGKLLYEIRLTHHSTDPFCHPSTLVYAII